MSATPYKNSAVIGYRYGESTCSCCGAWIKNLVLVRLETGHTVTLGTTCALKVGEEHIVRAVQHKRTTADKNQLQTDLKEGYERKLAADAALEVIRAERRARFPDLFRCLRAGNQFYNDLADQLEVSALTDNQANYAVEALYGRRKLSKKRELEADALWFSITTKQ